MLRRYRVWLQREAVSQRSNKQKDMHFNWHFGKVKSETTIQLYTVNNSDPITL